MEKVSYEYIASQQDNHGVLILSEFTGAAQSLNGMHNHHCVGPFIDYIKVHTK